MVLRIEDLDASRSKPEYADALLRDFESLGLTWDRGPYFQSGRSEVYREALDALRCLGLVYPCFCTRADLHAASAPHADDKPVYAGTCRGLDDRQRAARARELAEQGRAPALRLRVPDEHISLCDLLQGPYGQNLGTDCGDFVVKRGDGAFAYQLAVVVDDAEQGVTCVCRGVDLLASTPQQIHLQSLFGFGHPEYAHIPLLYGPDGRRLSKRHADAGLDALLRDFGSPDAVLGHIAYVAGMVDADEPASAEELAAHADLEALRGVRRIPW